MHVALQRDKRQASCMGAKLQRAGRAFLLRLIAAHGLDGAARILRSLACELEALQNWQYAHAKSREKFSSGGAMTKREAEKGIRHLCYKWAELRGIRLDAPGHPSFGEFWSWVQENHSAYLDFRTMTSVRYDVELWFDQEFRQLR